MFDLTCFSDADGAVIEFRSIDEFTEFANFFNGHGNVREIEIDNLESKFRYVDSFCMRIYRGVFSDMYGWYFGPTRASYERKYKVVNLEDIRIGSADLGEITSEEIAIETLFFA